MYILRDLKANAEKYTSMKKTSKSTPNLKFKCWLISISIREKTCLNSTQIKCCIICPQTKLASIAINYFVCLTLGSELPIHQVI